MGLIRVGMSRVYLYIAKLYWVLVELKLNPPARAYKEKGKQMNELYEVQWQGGFKHTARASESFPPVDALPRMKKWPEGPFVAKWNTAIVRVQQ